MTDQLTTYEKIHKHLFEKEDVATLYLSKEEMEIRRRWVTVYTMLLSDPFKQYSEIVTFLCGGGNGAFIPVTKSTAYRDIESVQNALGNMKNASKAWVRHIVYEALVKAIKKADDKGQLKELILAADKLGKYFKLDKDELDTFDWDSLTPPSLEPSDDVTLLENITPIPNLEERRRLLRKKLKSEYKIEDAQVIDEYSDES